MTIQHTKTTSIQHTDTRSARRAILAGILGALGFAAAASAHAESGNRTLTVLPRNAAQSALGNSPPAIESLKSQYAAVADSTGATAAAATTHLSYPYGVAVNTLNSNCEVYITNLFGGVVVYGDNLAYQGQITTGLSYPAGVAFSFNQRIYVANNGSNSITIYDNLSMTQIGTITDSTLANPLSIYIDPDDTVWVLDAAGVLHSYLNDGTTLPSTHTGGSAVGPWGPYVTVWGIADGNGGFDESFENRAQAVNTGLDQYSLLSGSPYAGGETQDQYGRQYVTDFQHNQVQIWDSSGEFQIGQINTPAAPYGIAVDNVHSRVYVAITTLNEVLMYSTVSPYKLLATIK